MAANDVVPTGYETKLRKAVAHYWATLGAQGQKQSVGNLDKGNRRSVTGGKQMDGFAELVRWVVSRNGMPEASIFVRGALEIPGYFRPTKQWDLLVIHENQLVAAAEFKSQVGPSFGNNFNNRTEEALGNATDIWTAYREGAFGRRQVRPWVGWIMFLEDCEGSATSVGVGEPHFPVFEEFRNASYRGRYEVMLRRLVLEKLYDGAALVTARRSDARTGRYREPATDLSMRRFLASLGGHVKTVLASR